ncbi:MazF family transcriptional regulator [Mycobacterium sp.]|uniref:MazF family transcriptional regulator n=2 Tax=Mycobacterium sp. TaxID=1785 RepID=UPI0031CE7A34
MLVISSTVYNEIPSEPIVIVVPIFGHDPDTGFGVPLGDGVWAAPVLSPACERPLSVSFRRRVDIAALTDVNNLLFRILATPDR